MKLKIKLADQIVGLFVMIAIAALCAILILLGANQRWFAKDYFFTSEFNSGQSLKEGMPISLKGFQIGAVDEITLQEDNNVGIVFHIYDTYYEKITANSVLELAGNPLGLGGGLLFHPGKSTGELITEGEKIPSLDFAEGLRMIKRGLVERPEGGDAITQILNSLGPLLSNVNSTVLTLNDTLGAVNQGLNGDTATPVGGILVEADALIGQLNGLLEEINLSIAGTMNNITNITGNIDTMTADPTGLAIDLLDPQGSVATLLNDENQIYNQIDSILNEINLALNQLQQFTVYLNSSQPQITGILDQGQDALEKGQEVLEGLTNNPILRGGITEQADQASTFQGYRDEDF